MLFKKFPLFKFFFFICFLFFSLSTVFAFSISNDLKKVHSALIFDMTHHKILLSYKTHFQTQPASLTKIMTLYLCYKDLKTGYLSLDQPLTITKRESFKAMPYESSVIGLKAGDHLSLLELMQGTAILSGNDGAFTLALTFSRNINTFVLRMNQMCQKLGMKNTHFADPSGYSPRNYTDASDLLILTKAYITQFPQALLQLHSHKYFSYPKKNNRKPFLKTYKRKSTLFSLLQNPYVDGLKTGYIDEVGFNLILTAKKNKTRYIIILLGIDKGQNGSLGKADRIALGKNFLSYAFSKDKEISKKS